jgi:3-oxoadipate enol-lactonase
MEFTLTDGNVLHYRVDDFTDPWSRADWILLVHGLAESGEAWFGWVPHLARTHRVARPDLRGFGRSSAMARDFPWSLDILVDDLAALVESLGARPIHVVGAKIGATTAVRFAARRPDLVATLTVVGLPLKGSKRRPGLDPKQHGVRAWARSSMEERLGADADARMLEYWSDLMGQTAESTLLGFSDAAGDFDVRPDLERVVCPVLAVTSDSPRHPVAETDAWRKKAHSELLIVPGEGYHAAAVHPDFCARATADFIARHPIA